MECSHRESDALYAGVFDDVWACIFIVAFIEQHRLSTHSFLLFAGTSDISGIRTLRDVSIGNYERRASED